MFQSRTGLRGCYKKIITSKATLTTTVSSTTSVKVVYFLSTKFFNHYGRY